MLVTETISDRYETTLQTLAEHLPLVVVELQVWKGENEAIVVPHVALSSDEVDLAKTPAAKAAKAVDRFEDEADEEVAREEIPFMIGQVVEISAGPFSEFSGTVEEVVPEKGKVKGDDCGSHQVSQRRG